MRHPRRKFPRGLKIAPIDGSVGELWATLQDAEEPREVLDQLRDRRRFPWKTLAFDQQPRPPYSGTFTKKSFVVGPRTPFAQDPIFDYSYDSGDDWQDDDEGEDVDNFGGEKNLEEEDEDEDEEDEGEFDDWLDDSEDVEAAQPDSMDVDDAREPEKLSRGVKKLKEQPIKRIVKLVPTWKGPVWENRIGEKGTEGLESYRIQLLNGEWASNFRFSLSILTNLQILRYPSIRSPSNLQMLLNNTRLTVAPPSSATTSMFAVSCQWKLLFKKNNRVPRPNFLLSPLLLCQPPWFALNFHAVLEAPFLHRISLNFTDL